MSFVYKPMGGSWYERMVCFPIVVQISSISSSILQYFVVGWCLMTEEQAREFAEERKDD